MPASATAYPMKGGGKNVDTDDDDDDETVDSSASATETTTTTMATAIPATTTTKKKKKKINQRNNRLTLISSKYDVDGDGVLDEAEQAMRDRDVANRGFLTNDEIYVLVQEQLKIQRSAGYMRKFVAGLICFVVLLALSNLGTSWASASLAKDLAADDAGDVPVMRNVKTGELAAAQSVAETYEATELPEDEYATRRLEVLEEMDADPHSHAHRRLKKKKNNSKISFDSDWMDERDFSKIETGCEQQRNVNIKVRRGDSSLNQCVCSRGTSVVVKDKRNGKVKSSGRSNGMIGVDCPGCMGGSDDDNGKKGKNKGNNNNKKDKGKNNNKNKKVKGVAVVQRSVEREVIIEQEDGRVLHADCKNGRCYMGGTTLQGELGDRCRLRADECGHHKACGCQLVCEPESTKGARGKGNSNLRSSSTTSSTWGMCSIPTENSVVIVERAQRQQRAGPGDVCLVGDANTCGEGYWCEPSDFDAAVQRMRSGGSAHGGYASSSVVISGPSGTVTAGTSNGGGNARNPRSSGGGSRTGSCQRSAGLGQTCWDDAQCGPGGRCNGLYSSEQTVIQGSSGTIVVGGQTSPGICG